MKAELLFLIFNWGTTSVVLYDTPRSHDYKLCKFLYFIDEDGDETLLVGSRDTFGHMDLLDFFNRQNKNRQLNEGNLKGAGMFGGLYVESWYSEGFNLWTPRELRPRICELLGKKD